MAIPLNIERKIRLLMLVKSLPFPLDNGVNLRIYYFCKYLSERCELHLCYLDEVSPPNELYQIFEDIQQLPEAGTEELSESWISRLIKKFSPSVLVDENSKASNYLETHVENYDLILSTTHLLPYLDFNRTTPIVVDIIDDAVLQLWRELPLTPKLTDKIRKLYYLFLQILYERRYCSNNYINAAFITSEVDAKVFKTLASVNTVQVIQNGVDPHYFAPGGSSEDENMIVFEGNMSFDQNVIGACYFCDEIFPLIREKLPNARLVLVGRNPDASVIALGQRENVVVTGGVEDIRPYLDESAVFVSPLLTGGGIKNKILQAWSMGKACVATTLSVGGLEVNDGQNILIKDGPIPFAAGVVELMMNKPKRNEMGKRARETILDSYSWEKKANELYELLVSSIKPENS